MKKIVGIMVSVCLIILDQLTKYFAVDKLKGKEDFIIIKKVLSFHYLENTGVAWGMFSNATIFFTVVTTFMAGIIFYLYMKIPSNRRMLPLNLIAISIFAGAFGNLIDRVVRGYVVDFIYFEPIDFPVFNVADCYVTVAGVFMMFFVIFYYKEEDFGFLTKNKRGNQNG